MPAMREPESEGVDNTLRKTNKVMSVMRSGLTRKVQAFTFYIAEGLIPPEAEDFKK